MSQATRTETLFATLSRERGPGVKTLARYLLLILLPIMVAGCTITKEASPATVNVGDRLTFIITVTNNDTPGLLNIITDALPDSVQFVSLTAPDALVDCETPSQPSGGTVSCLVGTEANTSTVAIEVTALQCGTFTNTATGTDLPLDSTDSVGTADSIQSAAQLADLIPIFPTIEDSATFTINCPQQQQQQQQQQHQHQHQQQPVCPPASQEVGNESQSGGVSPSFSVQGAGDNSNQTAAPLEFGNSGSLQNAQGVLQTCGSTADDAQLSGSSMEISPVLDAASNQGVGESSASQQGG